MGQNRASGAAADRWGRATARLIAHRLGATMRGSASNKATYEGRSVVFKAAARATNHVGVTFNMLQTLEAIVAAFQLNDGSFEVWSLPTNVFLAKMKPT